MSESDDRRLVNLLGAFGVALADRIREATEAASGLTGAGPAALVALEQFLGGRAAEDLARATGLTHSGAVRLVDRLVDAGLVERRPGRDGRTLSIVLTPKGRRLSRKVTAARSAAVEAVLARVGGNDRRALLALSETLVATETTQRLTARQHGDEPSGWLCRLCDFPACGRPLGLCPAANEARSRLPAPAGQHRGLDKGMEKGMDNMARLERIVARLPEAARVDIEAWGGEPTFRVRGKNFVFTDADARGLSVKLPKEEAAAVVATDPGAEPTGYGLGRHGWVSVQVADHADESRWQQVEEWVRTSYTLVAPRTLAKLVLAEDGLD